MKTGNQGENLIWIQIQNEIAEEKGLSIVLVDENSSELAVSNNNSICRFLYSSEKFAPRCAEFCGRAYETAREAAKIVHVKCYADLNYLVVPLKTEDRSFAAIVGRTFLNIEDYRQATMRASSGDWQEFPANEFFSNVLILRSLENLEKAAKKLEKPNSAIKQALEDFAAQFKYAHETVSQPTESDSRKQENSTMIIQALENFETVEKNKLEIERSNAWRETLGSLLESDYQTACLAVLEFLTNRFDLLNLAWLEPQQDFWEKVYAVGNLKDREIKIEMSIDDERLFEVLQDETALELRERAPEDAENLQTLRMFPCAIGDKLRLALIVGDEIENEAIKKQITRFLRNVTPELEILRLRQALENQLRISNAIKKFNESLKDIDGENFWSLVAQASAELINAERASVLGFDESEQKFFFKAAAGSRADIIENENETLGEKIAQRVLNEGTAIAVENIENTEFSAAPSEYRYKTKSFISYPIKIGQRKVGILNAADKADGGAYNQKDLELLAALAPQIAVALDRTTLKKRAGEFEQLSITDALTGLLNRRYLEERLSEEISRSQRSGNPVSFMMIDVDEFKSYNDRFSHPEGDKALKIVGRLMKETLRGADVAARYGGEEFSILLPQTNLAEALAIAERIREKIDLEDFPNRKVTVSIGVAVMTPQIATAHDLISAADKALYKAKQAGRNTVKVFEDSVSKFLI